MAISIPRWTGMLRRAGAPAGAATEIATEVDQTVDALVSQHEHDSAFDRLLYAMQLGFQHADARMDAMEARLGRQPSDRPQSRSPWQRGRERRPDGACRYSEGC